MSSYKAGNQLVASFMSALLPLENHLKKGRPLTALQLELISLALEVFGALMDAWKLQRGYTRRRADIKKVNKSIKPNPAAVALGRMGGLKGGIARAKKLSPTRRVAIARLAVRARWARASTRK